MKNYRVFLLCFVTFSGVFSIGLGRPVNADTVTLEKPKKTVRLESVEVEKTHKSLETDPVKTITKRTSVNAKENVVVKSNSAENSELQKPLDLSIPYNAGLKIKQNRSAQDAEPNIFTSETIKSQPLQLKGNLLMSPYPEAGKQKSVDGAGIIINIKP
ncbi:MAG: hypothetical protein ACU88J_08850 [Gammaproteobacteria bacterium]